MSKENEMAIVPSNGIFRYFLVFNYLHKVNLPHKMLTIKHDRKIDSVESHENSKKLTKNPKKRVHFSPNITVHQTYVWNFAYRQARKDVWQQSARDNARFKKK